MRASMTIRVSSGSVLAGASRVMAGMPRASISATRLVASSTGKPASAMRPGGGGGSGSAAISGMRTSKLLPTPGVLVTTISPPMALTSWDEIDSPRPVPPKRRVVELSACSKGRNRRSTCSGVMPMPVSLMRMHSWSASTRASRLTEPVSVNLMALPSTLTST